MSDLDYKVVALARDLSVMRKLFSAPDQSATVAGYVQRAITEGCQAGWEFYRIDNVSLTESPGCLGSLFGQKQLSTEYNVLIFRKPRA